MKRTLFLGACLALLLALASCGESKPPHEHAFAEPTVVKEATCELSGQVRYDCTGCEYSYTEPLPKLAHVYENDVCTGCGIFADINMSFALNEGGASYRVTRYSDAQATAVSVPATYRNLPVTVIGEEAFCDLRSLTSVTLPDSIKAIEDGAFSHCEALTEINLPEGLESIGKSAFRSCVALAEITLPESLTSLGGMAFMQCESLTELTLPAGVTAIPYQTFYYCTSLVRVTAQGDLTEIGLEAFRYCTVLAEVTAGGTPAIGQNAFRECKRFYALNARGLSAVGDYAFYGCPHLHEVTLAPSLTSIGTSAFEGCLRLAAVHNDSALVLTEGSTEHGYVARYARNFLLTGELLDAKIEKIGDFFYYYERGISTATGDEHRYYTLIDYMGTDVAPEFPSLESDAYMLSYYSIAARAFDNLPIVFAVIPEGVQVIEDNAFFECDSLLSVTVPHTAQAVTPSFALTCYKLAEIINRSLVDLSQVESVYKEVPYAGLLIFHQELEPPYLLTGGTSIQNADGVLYYDDHSTAYGHSFRYVLGYIGEGDSITIPALPTNRDYGRFIIRAYAFVGVSCDSITIPSGVTAIGDEAFVLATLPDVIIPNTVTEIGNCAFANATFTSLIVPDTAYADEILGYRSSTRHHYDEDGYIRLGSLLVFASTDLSDDVVLDATIKNIGFRAFNGCSRITSLTLADGTLTISAAAFMDCTSLTTITIPKSVVNLRANILRGCSSLTLIEYGGTTAEWRALTEGIMLSQASSLTAGVTVRCSDGNLTLDVYGQVVE